MWITFCNDGNICPAKNDHPETLVLFREGECLKGGLHTTVHYVNNERVKTLYSEEAIERWRKYLETKDDIYLDAERIAYVDPVTGEVTKSAP